MSKMTIISTARPARPEWDLPAEEVTPLDKGEGSLDLELASFPPVDDAIDFVKGIDWQDVGVRITKGTGALLLFAMKLSEWSYEFHNHLYDRYFSFTDIDLDVID